MSATILVTYATRYGSTEEVARVVAETLREHGLTVEVQHVRKVHNVQPYDAVVLGAPLYIGHWHKDAHRFLDKFADELAEPSPDKLPVAIFALGPLHDDDAEFQGGLQQLHKELEKYPALAPLAIELFGGKYDPERLNLADRVLASLPVSPLHGLESSDVRDWPVIRIWAANLARQIEPAPRTL
jgi:menaquinone-dependent protoporphyrinogen oxidase